MISVESHVAKKKQSKEKTGPMKLAVLISALLLSFQMSTKAFGSDYQTGYNQYASGNYALAEQTFKDALQNSSTTEEKAKTYKMLGICQYMQGKRRDAKTSFIEGIKLNYNITIASTEILDESILDFFTSIKKELPPSIANENRNKTGTLFVVSNLHADITIDTSTKAKANETITLDKGFHKLEISYPGFKSKAFPIQIEANKEKRIDVDLEKDTNQTASSLKPEGEQARSEQKETARKSSKKPDKEADREDKQAATKKHKDKKSKKRTSRKSRSTQKHASTNQWDPIDLAPFGIPQFVDENYVVASAFAVGQAASLGLALYQLLDNIALAEETSKKLEDMQAGTEKEDYEKSQQEEIDSKYTQTLIGFSLFVAIWGASIVENYLNQSANRVSLLYDKNRTPTPYKLAKIKSHQQTALEASKTVEKPDFSWTLLPSLHKKNGEIKHSFIMDFKLNF